MENLFVAVVKYDKIDENGKEKRVSEKYLIDAVSFTEAEARIYTEMEIMISGEFVVHDISRAGINEVHTDFVGQNLYKIKVSFMSEDPKPKKSTHTSIINADSVEEAGINIKEAMRDVLVDYVIESITDSKILDYFPYNN